MVKLKFLPIFAIFASFAFILAGCYDPLPGEPGSGSSTYSFNRSFSYYYSETCPYDDIGVYDCGSVYIVSPSYSASLKIYADDGYAMLNLDGDTYTYFADEYTSGYDGDYGRYYRFYEGDDVLDFYRDGYTLAYWGSDGYVTYYYYEYDF